MELKSRLALLLPTHVSWYKAGLPFSHQHKDIVGMPSHVQDCVGPEELLLSHLSKGLYGLTIALPVLGRLLIPFSLVGSENPHALSQWGRAVAHALSRSIKLTPGLVPNNTNILLG